MIGSNIRSMWHFPEMWTLIDATSVIVIVCSMLLSFAETPVYPLSQLFCSSGKFLPVRVGVQMFQVVHTVSSQVSRYRYAHQVRPSLYDGIIE